MSGLIESILQPATGTAWESLAVTLEQAVELGVRESDRLDWKLAPYDKKGGGDEFAKDVASFANARGGLLVLGVAEDRHTSAASKLIPFLVSDGLERQMRSWLPSRLDPAVPGLRFHPVTDEDGEGVLVIEVPESPDAPHLVRTSSGSGYPMRFGTHTEWMREFDIEKAYRLRFNRRSSEEARLAELITQTVDHLDFEDGCWIVAAARPSLARSEFDDLTRDQVRRVFEQAASLHDDLFPDQSRVGRAFSDLGNEMRNPRLGLRRWIAAGRSEIKPSARSDGLHVEVHNDGSVIVAVQVWRGGQREAIEGVNTLTDFEVNGVVVALVNLTAATSTELSVESDHAVRIECLRQDDRPFGMAIPQRHGPFVMDAEQPNWSRDVPRFIPVESVIPVKQRWLGGRRRVAQRLIADISTQFGIAPENFVYVWSEEQLREGEPARPLDGVAAPQDATDLGD